jgi:hypothetical protein
VHRTPRMRILVALALAACAVARPPARSLRELVVCSARAQATRARPPHEPGEDIIDIVYLEHFDAAQLLPRLRSPGVELFADPPTNSIVLRGPADRVARARSDIAVADCLTPRN